MLPEFKKIFDKIHKVPKDVKLFITDKKEALYQVYKKDEIRTHDLRYLFLEITRKCNLNCLHCGSDCKKDNNSGTLTTESWLKIIDYFHQNYQNNVALVITGGEPLMHHKMFTITAHIAQKDMRWGMVTNGMLLNQQKLDKLIEHKIYSITISFDGLRDAHNKLRNCNDAYDKTVEALRITGLSKIKFKDAVTCVYPDNLHQLSEIAKILIENKITSWRLFRIFPSGRAEGNKDILLTFEQTQEMLKWLAENKPLLKKQGLDVNLSCEGWLPFAEDLKVRNQPFFCRAGINIASILCDGNITGCSNNHSSFYAGNILNYDFNFLWNNFFESFRKRSWVYDTQCGICEYIDKCQGGSIHLWQKDKKKPSFCYVKKIV